MVALGRLRTPYLEGEWNVTGCQAYCELQGWGVGASGAFTRGSGREWKGVEGFAGAGTLLLLGRFRTL